MAIVQIGQIHVRRGLQQDLPVLGSGEIGWALDTRRLYIGNGTLVEGSPEVGNTEVLTEFSPLVGGGGGGQIPYTNPPGLATLSDNQAVPVFTTIVVGSGNVASIIEYQILRGTDIRVGTLRTTYTPSSGLAYEDSYTETANIGIVLTPALNAGVVELEYTSTSTGASATLKTTNRTL